MFSQDTYQGQGITQANTHSRAGELLARGISSAGQSIGAGIAGWQKKKAENKALRALYKTVMEGQRDMALADPNADAATIKDKFGEAMGAGENMSTADLQGWKEGVTMNSFLETQLLRHQENKRAERTATRADEAHKAKQQTTQFSNELISPTAQRPDVFGMKPRYAPGEDPGAPMDALSPLTGDEALPLDPEGTVSGQEAFSPEHVRHLQGQLPSADVGGAMQSLNTGALTPSERLAYAKEERSIKDDQRERTVVGLGMARSVKAKEELTAVIKSHSQAVPIIDSLIEVSNAGTWKRFLSPTTRGKMGAQLSLLKGMIREDLVGPGAVSETEWEMINAAVRSPAKWGQTKEAVQSALGAVKRAVEYNMELAKEAHLLKPNGSAYTSTFIEEENAKFQKEQKEQVSNKIAEKLKADPSLRKWSQSIN